MDFCRNCGSQLPDGDTRFCPDCGAPIPEPAPAQPSGTAAPNAHTKRGRAAKPTPADAPAGLDKKTFFSVYSAGRRNCIAAAIIGYVSAGATALFACTGLLGMNVFSLIDAAIALTLSLLIHMLRSRAAAILLLIYGAYNVIYSLVTTGSIGGWLIALAGVMAVIGAFACAKEWKAYLARTGTQEGMRQP